MAGEGSGGGAGKGARVGAGSPLARSAAAKAAKPTPSAQGQVAEDLALKHLLRQGLQLVARNYRVAGGPHRRGGEIDLIVRDRDGTLVFVEVRARASKAQGGAAASIGLGKRRSLILAAQHFLLRYASLPPCRFDVVALDGEELVWLRGAFDAG